MSTLGISKSTVTFYRFFFFSFARQFENRAALKRLHYRYSCQIHYPLLIFKSQPQRPNLAESTAPLYSLPPQGHGQKRPTQKCNILSTDKRRKSNKISNFVLTNNIFFLLFIRVAVWKSKIDGNVNVLQPLVSRMFKTKTKKFNTFRNVEWL